MAGRLGKFKSILDKFTERYFNQTIPGDLSVGFWVTAPVLDVIPIGGTGVGAPTIDLGANYKVIGITCENCAGIAAATNMSAQVSFDTGNLGVLYEQDDPGTAWLQGPLPVAGGLSFILTHAFGARCIRLILSAAVTAETTFKIYGFHSGS